MLKLVNLLLILLFLSGIIGLCYIIPQHSLADKITEQIREYQKIERRFYERELND